MFATFREAMGTKGAFSSEFMLALGAMGMVEQFDAPAWPMVALAVGYALSRAIVKAAAVWRGNAAAAAEGGEA